MNNIINVKSASVGRVYTIRMNPGHDPIMGEYILRRVDKDDLVFEDVLCPPNTKIVDVNSINHLREVTK